MGWLERIVRRAPAQITYEEARKGFQFVPEPETIRDFSPISATWWGESYGSLYRAQPAVRTVVDFLARNVAQLNPKVYLRRGNDDREQLDAHPLAVLLRNPNPRTTQYTHLRDTVSDLAVYGIAYWFKIRATGGKSQYAVMRLTPSSVTVDYDQSTGRTRYINQNTGKEIARDDLVIFRTYDPFSDVYGVSPLETLRRTLEEEFAAVMHRRHYWRNAARRDGIIERPLDAPEWSDEGRQRFRIDWENTHSGAANAGRTPVLEDGMRWNPDSFSPKDSEYVEGRKLTNEEVARVYGVAPNLLGIGDSANANIESFHRQLYQDTLGPWLKAIEDEIELQLLPDLDTSQQVGRVYVEFNLAEKLAASFEEQARTLVTSTGVPFMAINESRSRLNLPRIDDESFDMPVQPLNVMYGGQPAVTVPTEVPQPGQGAAAITMGSKAREAPAAALRRRQAAAERHRILFERYFNAQRRAFVAQVEKANRGIGVKWDAVRWDERLGAELFKTSTPIVAETGTIAARQIRGVFDPNVTDEFLFEKAKRSARNINQYTMDLLDDAEDMERIDEIFDINEGSRSTQLAMGIATELICFARNEAAKQSQADDGRERTKTWVVTSAHSRHPEMDGETVAVSDNFSNGLAWPGDAGGDSEEISGCQCLLDLS